MKFLPSFFLLACLAGPASEARAQQPAPEAASPEAGGPMALAPKAASRYTSQMNAAVLEALPFSDKQDLEEARKGFVVTLPEVTIKNDTGLAIFDLSPYDFLNHANSFETVNPSLWRLAWLNLQNGLFHVSDGIYQVRSFDASNLTIVESRTGIIVVDPVSNRETARMALDLYYSNRGVRPVVAVVYTHSHMDHYGGVKGVISEEEVKKRNVRIIAPEGFLEAAISENVYAGTAMSRRTAYFYGMLLPRGDRGHVDSGIGKVMPAGTPTLIAPTETIRQSGTRLNIDGVNIEFLLVSETEAPAEMTLYFTDWDILNSAEIACPLMHNILTLRGAQVRDSKKWGEDLQQCLTRYGSKVKVLFAQHHWPRWGNARIVSYLAGQRDMYKYLHDQTLRLINLGYTGTEIAEMISLPPSLAKQWYTRGYYGTVNHNVKAIYQKYIGWFDGNPANLHMLPPVENARKLVRYLGGSAAAIARARQDFQRGEYRWVAWIMGQVVFAEPENRAAQLLEADALEQLGYQSEAASWRNSYLVGAMELRHGIQTVAGVSRSGSADTIKAMTIPMYFDYMGIRLNGPKAEGRRIVINWTFTDSTPAKQYVLNLENCVLSYREDAEEPNADTSLRLARSTLDAVTLGTTTLEKEIASGNIKITGNPQRFAELMSILDTFPGAFPIVTP